MSPKLQSISDYIISHLPELIAKAEDEINAAIESAVDLANEEEKEPILSLPIAVKWNLDTNAIFVKISISFKSEFKSEGRLGDPNQQSLKLLGDELQSEKEST